MLKSPSRRWWVLATFAFAAGVTQMLWLNFAPLLQLVQKRYGVSELLASTLVLVFPLLYVVLSLPSGALIDRKGYRFGILLGAVVTAAFAAVRLFDFSFWALFVGQLGIAVAQPFVLNGISKLVSDWFDESQSAVATGIGTMGMFVGMAVGMATTVPLEQALGLRGAMAVFLGIAVVAAIACAVVIVPRGAAGGSTERVEFGPLLRDRTLFSWFACSFLGLGTFNGLTTWLEDLLAPHGVDAETAGLIGGALIVAGIFGAVVIPLIAEKTNRRQPALFLCVLIAALCVWPLCNSGNVPLLMAVAGVLGFFFMPAFALLLDLSAQHAGAARAGAATSVLMLAGNLGGVIVIVALPLLKGLGRAVPIAAMAVLLLLAAGLVLTVRAKQPQPAQ